MDRFQVLELAMMAMASGDPSSAADHCEDYLKSGPGDAWLYKTYATALLLLNRLEEAEAASNELLLAAGSDPKFQFDSGIVSGEVALRRSRAESSGRPDQLERAETALRRSTTLFDHAGKYGRCLAGALHAEALLELGREDEARRIIRLTLDSLKGTSLEGPGIFEENTRETSALANITKRAGVQV